MSYGVIGKEGLTVSKLELLQGMTAGKYLGPPVFRCYRAHVLIFSLR